MKVFWDFEIIINPKRIQVQRKYKYLLSRTGSFMRPHASATQNYTSLRDQIIAEQAPTGHGSDSL